MAIVVVAASVPLALLFSALPCVSTDRLLPKGLAAYVAQATIE
jgi:hypothetical protein